MTSQTNIVATVYDETRSKHYERHALLVILHLASWKANVSASIPLRVYCIREPNPVIRDHIEQLGAELVIHDDRHPLFDRGPCYNKHLASPADGAAERLFLTDNDTIYIKPVDELFSVPDTSVAAAFAPRPRISAETWQMLIDEFGANPIAVSWKPEAVFVDSLGDASAPATPYQQYGYFNGGAILFPRGNEFWKLWEQKSYQLSEFLLNKGLNGQKTVGTDQASLCLTMSDYGDWNLLPEGMNYFSFSYVSGYTPPAKTRHIHVAGIGRHYGRMDFADKVSGLSLIEHYWNNAILQPMAKAGRSEEDRDIAASHRDMVLSLIRDYELDDLRKFSPPKGTGHRSTLSNQEERLESGGRGSLLSRIQKIFS